MDLTSTIVALASAPGRSARAIIRLSGPGAFAALRQAAGPSAPSGKPSRGVRPARLHLRQLNADLPVLVVTLTALRSYTGEDTVEILLPGSPALVGIVIDELLDLSGVRAAEPGEFSARAYLGGRLSLDQAEGVAQRIAAASAAQLHAADRLLSGEAGREESAWAQRLAQLLALVEAGVDFTDQEDVHPIPALELRAQLEALAAEIDARLGRARASEATETRPMVALAGAPNAGKSTLLNALVGRQRAVTSAQPGATRDAIAEVIDLSAEAPLAGEVTIVDLPGLERAADSGAAGAAQRNLLETLARADVLIHCDPSGAFAPLEVAARGETPIIRVRTMADLGGWRPEASPPPAPASSAISLCALDGFGLSELKRAIASAISGAGSHAGEATLLAPRRRRALAEARAGLASALAALHEGSAPGSIAAPELVAAAMRHALDALGALAGHITPDEVLGEVFRTFCIGK